MGLIKCKDCGKEVSPSAEKCPNCGRPIKKRSNLGCLLVVILLLVIFIGPCISCMQGLYKYNSTYVEQQEKEEKMAMTDQLELLSSSGQKSSSMHMKVEGQVKNITQESLKNVEVIVQWYDKNEDFVTKGIALIDYNPILSGQTSPFDVISTYNPAMEKYSISFKSLRGGTIIYKDSRK